jgi:hypothetical protein
MPFSFRVQYLPVKRAYCPGSFFTYVQCPGSFLLRAGCVQIKAYTQHKING